MSETEIYLYRRALTAFASTITRDWEEARDVVQDVYTECVARQLNPGREYLFRSVRNRCLNVIRSRNRLQRVLEKLHELTELMQSAIVPAHADDIIESVLNLPPHYKQVVILRIHSGMTVAEVSSVLAIPEGTVKSRLNTALKILRKSLEA